MCTCPHIHLDRGMVRVCWSKGLVPAVVLAATLLYLTSVNWKTHSKRDSMVGEHGNNYLPANYSMQSNDILKRLERMEAHINQLGKAEECLYLATEYHSSVSIHECN